MDTGQLPAPDTARNDAMAFAMMALTGAAATRS